MDTDNTKVVVIKRYTFPAAAFLDKTILEDNGIDAMVGSPNASSYPGIPNQVTLMVNSDDAERAAELITDAELPE